MEQVPHEKAPPGEVEFVKGCPVCEHSDPQLERDLEEFARMLFEVMPADEKKEREARRSLDVDNTS
jgi:hypothetical protein